MWLDTSDHTNEDDEEEEEDDWEKVVVALSSRFLCRCTVVLSIYAMELCKISMYRFYL